MCVCVLSEAIHFLLRIIQLFSPWVYLLGAGILEAKQGKRLVLLFSQLLCSQLLSLPLLYTTSGVSGVKLLAVHFLKTLVSV